MISIGHETHDPPNGRRAGKRPLYAIGDVHGCYDLLRALLNAIAGDAADRHPGVRPLLILCGDYVDRGPDSAKVLAALSWLVRSSAVDVRLLMGNHEAMLLRFLEHPAEHRAWLSFDGTPTLRSYGVDVPDNCDDATLTALRDRLLDQMPSSHHALLHRLEPMVEVGDYAFVHAGVMPGVPLRSQHRDDLLWIREPFLDHPRPSSSVIVHGHTWIDDRPTLLPHRIGIDTGAYETGVLTAVRIADDGIGVMQAVRGRDGHVGSADRRETGSAVFATSELSY